MNKKSLYVLVKFISKKSISFSCKLEFYDDLTDCRVYSLPVSATADNNLLTNFEYLTDSQNIYKLETQMVEVGQTHNNRNQPKVNISSSLQLQINLKLNDGRNLIDRYHSLYEDSSP